MKRRSLRTRELPEFAGEIVAQLEEIEACALRGVLRDVRRKARYSGHIDGEFWKHLSWPELTEIQPNYPKRQEWIETCLRRFQARLREPTHRFQCHPGTGRRETECGAPEGVVHLRFDQIAYQRLWGIELFSSDPDYDAAIAGYCVREAFARLCSDWESVNRFCTLQAGGRHLQHLCFTTDRRGNRFEQLILGILNEQSCEAEAATLYQDACEWTDLLLLRSGGVGVRGRVQTKFYGSVAQNDAEVSARYAVGMPIVISPVEIARYLERCMTAQSDPVWVEFLQHTGRRIGSLDELSGWIYGIFADVMEAPLPEHPCGLIASVPWHLRRAVRGLIESKRSELEFPACAELQLP